MARKTLEERVKERLLELSDALKDLCYESRLRKDRPLAGTAKVLKEVSLERKYQDKKWGGPEHDDEHGRGDWESFIHDYLYGYNDAQKHDYRTRMIKAAALCVAAVESYDRKKARGEEA